jgi:catechol 2,3-dioxygenase-like lactoylglutathione lyase family enzyme
VFRIDDPIFIPVKDLERARLWYREKLGCRDLPFLQTEPGTVTFWLENDCGILRIFLPDPKVPGTREPDPYVGMISTHNIKKAHRLLESRGVVVGPIRNDRQGTHYFEFHDADENLLEISEEP